MLWASKFKLTTFVLTLIGSIAARQFAVAGTSIGCRYEPLRIAIDIGHSRENPGATSARGKKEYEFNKRFAEELFKARGDVNMFLLNPKGEDMGLRERSALAAARNATFLISIHHDSVNRKYISKWTVAGQELEYSDKFRGFSIFVYEGSKHYPTSLELARLIGKNFASAGVKPALHHREPIPGEGRKLLDRAHGVYAAPFAVLTSADIPALLLEVGVIANREDETEIEEPSYRARLQSELLQAIQEFCRPA